MLYHMWSNKKDKTIIEKIHGDGGQGAKYSSTPVKAAGNIEDWLVELPRRCSSL